MARTVRSIEDRFWDKVEVIPFHTCWEWTGSKWLGYGKTSLRVDSKYINKFAHRLSFEMINGPIPTDKVVMHTCDNRGCVNPNHLKLGTTKENVHDCINKGRKPKIFGKFKSHCKSGHQMIGKNIVCGIVNGLKRRYCRECKRQQNKKYRSKSGNNVEI